MACLGVGGIVGVAMAGAAYVAATFNPNARRRPFSALKYTLDFGAMVGEAVKQKTEAVREEVKTKAQDQIKSGLQGLFK